jgi:hypothetical protein
VKAGWGEEGERVQDHALGVRRRHAAPLFSLGFSLECLLKDGFTDATAVDIEINPQRRVVHGAVSGLDLGLVSFS